LYGFKKSETELLLDDALGLPSDVKERIIIWLKEENDGYFLILIKLKAFSTLRGFFIALSR